MNGKNHTILRDFKQNWVFLLLLFIGATPQFINRSLYLWLLLLVFYWIRHTIRINFNCCFILLFSFTYSVSRLLYNPPEISIGIFYILYPFIMYECGIYICKRMKNFQSVILILFFIVLCYSSWSIYNNFIDYIETGAIVNPMRDLVTNNIADDHFIPATQHNSMLAMAIGGIGIIFIKANGYFQKYIKIAITILSVVALFASLHLLNRSAIIIAIVALLTGYLWNGMNRTKLFLTFIYIAFLLLLILVIFKDSIIVQSIIEGFSNRELNESGSAETGGDRFGRWLLSPYWILTHPLGSDGLLYDGMKVMVHNTWLDIGIDSGIVAFIIMAIITVRLLRVLITFIRNKNINPFYRGYILLVIVALGLQFAVEPLLRAFHPLFYIIFLIWGILESKEVNHYRPSSNTIYAIKENRTINLHNGHYE